VKLAHAFEAVYRFRWLENALRKANIKFDPRPRKIIEQKQTIAQKLRNFRCFNGLKGEKFRGIPRSLESCF